MSVQIPVPEIHNSPSQDEIAQHQITAAICAMGYPELKTVRVRVHEGLATLFGEVSSYHLKQVAQSVAMRIRGVDTLCNQIAVSHSSCKTGRKVKK